MAIIKWQDPFRLMARMPVLWEDEDFLSANEDGLTVYETDDEAVVKANVAGVPAEKVDISFEGGVLTIKAKHEEKEEEKKKRKVVYRQARKTEYYYTTSIPCPVKTDKIEAKVKDGIVTITLPKEEKAKPKKIQVKAQSK